jgi:hypothetical protein
MEQVVDSLLAQLNAEFGSEDTADLGVVEGTDAVLGGGSGFDPLPQSFVLGGVEPALAAAGEIGQSVGAAVIVAPRPLTGPRAGCSPGTRRSRRPTGRQRPG